MNRGFTLIELLVVISIIGLLTSITLVQVEKVRANARNKDRISAVESYRLGLEQVYEAYNNTFPTPGAGQWFCLSRAESGRCWQGIYQNSATLDSTITPFVLGRPNPDPIGVSLEGIVYLQSPTGSGYRLVWMLEGEDQDCTPGVQQNNNYYGDTYCDYIR